MTKKTIARTSIATFAVLLLVSAAVAEAQGRRGGGSAGGGGNGGAAGSTLQKGAGGPQGQPMGRGAGTASQDRQRLHVSDLQRGQYQDCSAAGDRLRQQGREMANSAKGSGFSAAEARRQRDQLSQGAGDMFRQHDRLMGHLGDNARSALQDRTRTLDRDRDRIHAHLQAMDRELARGNPDQSNLRAEARKLNRAMKTWQKHYRQLGQDLGAPAG